MDDYAVRARENILFSLLVLVIYIDFPLVIGSFLLPSAGALILSIPIFLYSWRDILNRAEGVNVLFLLLFFLVSAMFFGDMYNYAEKLKSFFQALVAILISFLSYSFLVKRRAYFVGLSKWVCISVVVLSIFEVLGPLKALSDAFRNSVFSSEFVTYLYVSYERDIDLVGFSRPNVFSAEPSFVSILFWVFSICYLKLDNRRFVFISLVFLNIIMTYLFRSPINYSLFLLLAYVYFFEDRIKILGKLGSGMVFVFIPLCLFLLPNLLSLLGRSIDVSSLIYLDDIEINSEMLRLIVPIHTISDVWNEFPIFGAGLGGKGTIEEVSLLHLPIELAMGTNSLAYAFMYFGMLGGGVFYLIILCLMKKSDNDYLISIVPVYFLYGNMLGGFVTVRYWFFIFVLLAAYHLAATGGRSYYTATREL
jgi:hypothetical protein